MYVFLCEDSPEGIFTGVYDAWESRDVYKRQDYKVTYPKNRKNVGVYTAKVTFQGNYTGTKSLTFRIDPKATSHMCIRDSI